VYAVAFAPSGTLLASVGDDKTLRLWDLATGKERAMVRAHEEPVFAVAFSADGKRLATGSGDNTIKLWDVRAMVMAGSD
jgi:WD40 repeat protein